MLEVKTPNELKELLGYNNVTEELCGETFENLFNRLKSGDTLLLDFDKLKELFELVREDVWEESSNPAFYSC